MSDAAYYAHPTAVIDVGAVIGRGTKIWHFAHVMGGARIGADCVVGHGCYIGNVAIGRGCRIQNQVSVFDGVELGDEVFVGPSAVFTNVKTPRAAVSRRDALVTTRIGTGASIGANATVVCGVTVGPYAMIGAGAVVDRAVPAHGLWVGVPARPLGWVCRCGERLVETGEALACGRCGDGYLRRGAELHRATR